MLEDAPSPALVLSPALARTRGWVNHAVIGLNLCPFAKAVQVKGQIRYVLCEATDTAELLREVRAEMLRLVATPPEEIETTLVVHPYVLTDFLDFNDFLAEADGVLAELALVGVLQVASFHPQFQFAGTQVDDITNATNQSPYPTLHLLREESVSRAVEVFPDAARIYEANMATLEELGEDGWQELQARYAE